MSNIKLNNRVPPLFAHVTLERGRPFFEYTMVSTDTDGRLAGSMPHLVWFSRIRVLLTYNGNISILEFTAAAALVPLHSGSGLFGVV